MAAPKKNQFWTLRNKHGREKLFSTPEMLWDAACEYFKWCDDNPWSIEKTKTKLGVKEKESTPTQRPYSLKGMTVFLGVSQSYWFNFKKNTDNEDFLYIITRIEDIIETMQLEGAMVGAFNANIVARKLGLSDKQDVVNSGELKANVTIKVVDSLIPLSSDENDIQD